MALSDAQYVAPLVQTGDFLSVAKSSPESGPNTFFYVFDYQTKDGDYPQVKKYGFLTIKKQSKKNIQSLNIICNLYIAF